MNLEKFKELNENNISNDSPRDSSHKIKPNSIGKKHLFKPSNSSLLSINEIFLKVVNNFAMSECYSSQQLPYRNQQTKPYVERQVITNLLLQSKAPILPYLLD
jgi:hypothetical protein